MKNQIEYVYSCTNSIFEYLKSNNKNIKGNVDLLIVSLRKYENMCRENKNSDKSFHFNLNNHTYTIENIEKILNGSQTVYVHQKLIKDFEWLFIDMMNELRITFQWVNTA